MVSALWNHLWQSTLFLGAAWVVTALLRQHSSRVRYLVWFAASLKFLVPWSALVALGEWIRPEHPIEIGVAAQPLIAAALSLASPAVRPVPISDFGPTVGLILLTIWAGGTIISLVRWALCWLHTRRTIDAADIHVMNAPIEVRISDEFEEPGVFGILEPVLMLPRKVVERMNSAELDAVIAHELCHIRNRDNLTAALHMLSQAAFWFHPLVWWLGSRLLEERERACDETVVQLGTQPRIYAEGIVKACAASLEAKLGVVAGASGTHLTDRIRSILAHRRAKSLGVLGKGCLTVCTAAAIVLPVTVGAAIANDLAKQRTLMPASLSFTSAFIQTTEAGSAEEPRLVLSGGRISMRNTSLRRLVSVAYDTGERRIFGPAWLDQRYDIEARVEGLDDTADSKVRQQMVVNLLTKEFALQFIEREWGSTN